MADRDDLSLPVIGYRLRALDRWRDRVDHRLDDLDSKVDQVVSAQTIAKAVADELAKRKTFEWSTLSKIGAFVLGCIVIAGSIKGLVG